MNLNVFPLILKKCLGSFWSSYAKSVKIFPKNLPCKISENISKNLSSLFYKFSSRSTKRNSRKIFGNAMQSFFLEFFQNFFYKFLLKFCQFFTISTKNLPQYAPRVLPIVPPGHLLAVLCIPFPEVSREFEMFLSLFSPIIFLKIHSIALKIL